MTVPGMTYVSTPEVVDDQVSDVRCRQSFDKGYNIGDDSKLRLQPDFTHTSRDFKRFKQEKC